jgi:sialic acid synthase SpsE
MFADGAETRQDVHLRTPDVLEVPTLELRSLVDGVRFLERARGAPVDKDGVAAELADMRSLFGKSLVSTQALPAGTTLTHEHLTAKKPATGIPASERASIVGRTLRSAVEAGHVLELADLADAGR